MKLGTRSATSTKREAGKSEVPEADKSDVAAAGADVPEADKSEVREADKSDMAAEATENDSGDLGVEGKSRGEISADRRPISIPLRSLVIGVVFVALVGAVGVFAWLYVGGQRKLDAQARQMQNYAHAEKISLDYAVNAAAMNFEDTKAWKVKLVEGTTPELKDKLTKAADSMEQLLVPLQWTSTARPLVAKVRSDTSGTYVVDTFVSVMTKTAQSPDPLQSTATYSITLDSSKDWKISDVGGIGAVAEQK